MTNSFPPLAKLVNDNLNIIAAWFDPQTEPATLHVVLSKKDTNIPKNIPSELLNTPTEFHTHEPIKPLITYDILSPAANDNQDCQNEPIQLGTQIQPSLANWLGTAGAPVRWLDQHEQPHWGILSNWHVMAAGHEKIDRAIHQPNAAANAATAANE